MGAQTQRHMWGERLSSRALAEIRKRRRVMSWLTLATKLGTTAVTLEKLESGGRAKPEVVAALERALEE
jgi:transcriptional regulator with XRE-family HTH domain